MIPLYRRLCLLLVVVLGLPGAGAAGIQLEESVEVAKVVSVFRVGFCLLTDAASDTQYVGYYDDERRMTVAKRTLGSDKWSYQVLPSKVGWDSHNYLTMALDETGNLHVTGNMHGDPLVYFVTTVPGEIASLKPRKMTGEREERVTYPKFLTGPAGGLVFNYRDGGSGRGARFYNRFDAQTGSWSRLLDEPLLDGEGKRNAYPLGPVRGPDGWFHLVWVWRMTPDCATNHHLSYARSRDLVAWESISGREVELPMTFDQEFLLIDAIPVGGGIINGGAKLAFDDRKRPLVVYHKSDAWGKMQVYAARPGREGWEICQLSDWDEPVKFSGNGSMGFVGIRIGRPVEAGPGVLAVSYRHRVYGSGRLYFDKRSLKSLEGPFPVSKEIPAALDELASDFPGMGIRRTSDLGESGEEGVRYLLQWESLGAFRDKARKPPFPKPSVLRVHRLGDGR